MRQLVVLLAGLAPVVALAGTDAIEKTNYSLGAGYSTVDFHSSSATQSSYSISAQSRFAVDDNAGMSLGASIDKTYFKDDSYKIEPSTWSAQLGIFLRDYDIGIVNIGFSHSNIDINSTYGSSTLRLQSLSLGGTYYLGKFDLSAGASKFGTNLLDDSSTSSNISAGYYINDNLRLSASVSGLDSSGSRSVGVIFQPAVLSNQWSLSGGFSTGTDPTDAYSLSLSYYFDTKVSLLERNRKY